MIDKNRQTLKHKWDRQSLNQKEKISQCQEKIQSKLQEIGEETDVNQDWQNLKQMILKAGSEFELSKDAKNTNRWWDDECKGAMQEKNEERRKCLIRRTRANLDNYSQKRTKANRICRRKKKEWLDNKIKEINKINRNRDTIKFYKDVRNLSNEPFAMTLVCKDKDDNIVYCQRENTYWQDGNSEVLQRIIKS
jgi:hypothetical protein